MRFPLLFLIPVSLALYTCTRSHAQSHAVPNTLDHPAQSPADPLPETKNPLPFSSFAPWRFKTLPTRATGISGSELTVDRNDGKGFVPVAYDTTPSYQDTAQFPAPPHQVDLQGHLPRRRPSGRPMELRGQRHRWRLSTKRRSSKLSAKHETNKTMSIVTEITDVCQFLRGRKLRVLKPGDVGTADINPGRVTIQLADSGRIESVQIDPDLPAS